MTSLPGPSETSTVPSRETRPTAGKEGSGMGLYKRGQVWWMRFTYQGRFVRKPTGTTDKKLAERIYHKVRGDIAQGRWFEAIPAEQKTFRELMARYLCEHAAVNKKPTTYRRDRSLADHL